VEKANISNQYRLGAMRSKLEAEVVCVYRPENEGDWSYCHHPQLTFFKQRWYAMWSTSPLHEDDVGQRVVISSSDDFNNWSKPKQLAASHADAHPNAVLTAAGFHEHAGTLVAYYGCYEYALEHIEDGNRKLGDTGHLNTRLYAVASTDGIHWEGPIDLKLPLIPNHGPQRTSTGRLIICGNTMFPYTDDSTGLHGWKKTGIYPQEDADELKDDSESIWSVQERMGWPNVLCEGAFYQTDDDVIHMLLRSNTEKLWVTRSLDDGMSWSPPVPTDFTDNATKFHFGRLPDGRYYYVGCPDPEPRWQRNPLVLSLSEDGSLFDRNYILGDDRYEIEYPGMHKGGDYGYPHSLFQDGMLYVIFSTGKERINVMRVAVES